jgi:nucleoside-diphosphate-sugar epimerase
MALPTPDALIIGCGYLGRRVAARWLAAGRRVAALTRRNGHTLSALGLDTIVGDVLDPNSLRHLPPAPVVLYAVGYDRGGGQTMRAAYVDGLGHVLDVLPPPRRFLYVSSTGVYGQTNGGWVDELSSTEPVEESGRVVLEAERLLRARLPDAVILRFAGIYGPDRLLRRQPLLKGEPLVGDPEKWLNLIHVTDGADAVLAAERQARPGETYLIADDEPVPRRDFYSLLAGLLKAPPAAFDLRPETGSANRRVSNRKARAELGWIPCFPTYREGLPAAVRESA